MRESEHFQKEGAWLFMSYTSSREVVTRHGNMKVMGDPDKPESSSR